MSIQNLQTYGNVLVEERFFSVYNLLWAMIVLSRWDHFTLLSFAIIDPFSDANKGLRETSLQDTPIHIRIQQRNGRKTLTTVQGIHDGYDKKKLVKAFKKVGIPTVNLCFTSCKIVLIFFIIWV